jgi:hypothetical protein
MLLEHGEARTLEVRIVVIVEVVEADHLVATRQQFLRGVEPDEPRGSRQ